MCNIKFIKIVFFVFITSLSTGSNVSSQCLTGCPSGSVLVNTSNWNVPSNTSGVVYCIPQGTRINNIQSLNTNNITILNLGTIAGTINSFNSQNSTIHNCGVVTLTSGFNVPQGTFIFNSNRLNVTGNIIFNGSGGGFYGLANSMTSIGSLTLNGGSSLTVSGAVNISGSLIGNSGAIISGGTGNGSLNVTGTFSLNSPSTLTGPSLTLNKAPSVSGTVSISKDVVSSYTPSIITYSPTFIQLCAGLSSTISVVASAPSGTLNPKIRYEWQIQTITNGAWLQIDSTKFTFCKGLLNPTLTLAGIPLSASGYFLRAKVIGEPSTNFVTSSNTNLKVLKSGTSFNVTITTTSPSGICPNTPVTVTATTDGNGLNGFYKWIRNSFFFTTNASLGITVSGATFNFATVTTTNAIQAVFYDNCFTNPATSNGLNIFPAVLGSWQGETNNDWSTANNWKCGVLPNSTTDVFIDQSALNFPQVLNSDAICKNLTIGNMASLSILGLNSLKMFGSISNSGILFDSGSGLVDFNSIASVSGSGNLQFNSIKTQNRVSFLTNTISISGDIINNGTFNDQTTAVYFNGNKKQNIGGNTLTINGINAVNNKGLLLNTPVFVKNYFNFMDGIVTTTSINSLAFGSTAQALNQSFVSYVNGPVIKNGVSNFTFPVGKKGKFNPLSISGMNSSNGVTSVEYFDDKTTNAILGASSQYITLKDCEYWQLKNLSSPLVSTSAKIAVNKGSQCNFYCDTLQKLLTSTNGLPWDIVNSNVTNGVINSIGTIPITNNAITIGSTQFLIDTRFVNHAPFKVKFKSQGHFLPINFSSINGTNNGIVCVYPSSITSSDSVFVQIMEKLDQNDSLSIKFSIDKNFNLQNGIKIGKRNFSGLHTDYYDFISDPFKGKILSFYLDTERRSTAYQPGISTNLTKGIIANSDSLTIKGLGNFIATLYVYDKNNQLKLQSSKIDFSKPSISAESKNLLPGTYKYTLRFQKINDNTFYKHNGQFIKPN